MAFIDIPGKAKVFLENYKTLYTKVDAEILSLEAARGRFGDLFKDAHSEGASECFWNPGSGWAEAEGALRNIIEAAIGLCVRYHQATVSTLAIDENGTCTGVHTKEGELLTAGRVILCTGALTAKLLADTAPKNKEFQVGERLVAVGTVSCTASFAPELIKQFEGAPVIFNGRIRGEFLPPTSDGVLKFNSETSFRNTTYHSASSQAISIPPQSLPLRTWGSAVLSGLKEEINDIVLKMFGISAPGIKIEKYRECWDTITPTQNFLITPHPIPGLYIVAGGSFHAWKFFPIIGKYVVKMLDGHLNEEETERWAWDCKHEGNSHAVYILMREYSNIDGYEEFIVGTESKGEEA